jgi:hypothetical protein
MTHRLLLLRRVAGKDVLDEAASGETVVASLTAGLGVDAQEAKSAATAQPKSHLKGGANGAENFGTRKVRRDTFKFRAKGLPAQPLI